MVKNDLPIHSSTPEKSYVTNSGINNYGYDLSYVQTTGIFICVNFLGNKKIIDFKINAEMFSFAKKIYVEIFKVLELFFLRFVNLFMD